MPEAEKFTEEQQQAAHHVLYYYGEPGGYPPGSFTTYLMEAYTSADHWNRARLRGAFPEIAEAMDMVIGEADGLKKLAERFRS